MSEKINLVERHVINKNHKFFIECDKLCSLSKNLYNKCLYDTRQHFFETKEFLNYYDNYKELRYKKDYKRLPDKVSKQTLKMVDQNYRSFFKAVQDYLKHPKKYKSIPKIPRYLDKDDKFVTTYEKGAISTRSLRSSIIKLSKTNITLQTKKATLDNIVQCRIVPKLDYYVIEVIYKKEVNLIEDNNRHASIDMGVENLMALTYNTGSNPVLFKGKNIKQINVHSNYIIGKIKSELEIKNDKKTSKKLKKCFSKREMKLNDILHKNSSMLVNLLAKENISVLIVGQNKRWKQNINIGRKNNREFVSIPFYKLISQLKYKCLLKGITLITTEESYTSKCSFIDDEKMCKHTEYLGERINRNEFVSNDGEIINADINGSYNIMRKVMKSFRFHEGLAVNPEVLSI